MQGQWLGGWQGAWLGDGGEPGNPVVFAELYAQGFGVASFEVTLIDGIAPMERSNNTGFHVNMGTMMNRM